MSNTKLKVSASGTARRSIAYKSAIINRNVSQRPENNLEQYEQNLHQAVKNMNSYPSNFVNRVYEGIVRTLTGKED